MKQVLFIFKLKQKIIGPLLFLPWLAFLLITLFSWQISTSANIDVILLQILFNPIAFLWIVYLFQDWFRKQNYKYLKGFYCHKVFNIIIVNLAHLIMPIFLLVAIFEIKYTHFDALSVLLLLISQLLLTSVFAILLGRLFRNVVYPAALYFLYMSAELATFGQNSYLYHLFVLSKEANMEFATLISLSVLNLLIAFFGFRLFKLITS